MPNRAVFPRMPALGDHIGQIVFLRAEKEMFDIHARWVIALVQDIHPFRDLAMLQFPSYAMCVTLNPFASALNTQ